MVLTPAPAEVIPAADCPVPLLGAMSRQDKPGTERRNRRSIAASADEAGDTGDDRRLLIQEAVRSAALAGLKTGVAPARASTDRHHLLARAIGARRDLAHQAGGRARTMIGGMADDQDRRRDRFEPKVEDGLRHPGP